MSKTNSKTLRLIECPRDAMQGREQFIPTELKIQYLNALLKVGFDTLDFGSFVSPKAVPQMADTIDVLEGLDLGYSNTQLLAIVPNARGAQDALKFEEITYIGYPFSISETFQRRNTNQTRVQAMDELKRIADLCVKKDRELVVYLSMAFGNPYGDEWSDTIVEEWAYKISKLDIVTLSLADTVGQATAADITKVFTRVRQSVQDIELGAHFHAQPTEWQDKVEAAWQAGVRRFDGALRGFGGCPFADDHLVGNIATENLIAYAAQHGTKLALDLDQLNEALLLSQRVFQN